MEDIDKRLFYLMLSPTEGQRYAEVMGFSPPSIDVQEMEVMDTLYRWVFLAKAGVVEMMSENVDLFLDLLESQDKLPLPREEFSKFLTSFSVSMLNTLIDNQLLGVLVGKDIYEELQDE